MLHKKPLAVVYVCSLAVVQGRLNPERRDALGIVTTLTPIQINGNTYARFFVGIKTRARSQIGEL